MNTAEKEVSNEVNNEVSDGALNEVVMYSTRVCPYCQRAEQLLKLRGVKQIKKVLIDQDPVQREEMIKLTGRRTVPQIFINHTHVGGYDDLAALDRDNGLLPLLKG